MKIDTKITEQDKKLLVLLAMFLLIVGFTYFFIEPLIRQIHAEVGKWQEEQQLQRENEIKINRLSSVRATNKQLKMDVEEAANGFYDEMSSDEIDQLLTGRILKSGLSARQLKIIMSTDDLALNPYLSDASLLQEETESPIERFPYVLNAKVTILVSGNSNKLQSFVDDLIEESPSIRVTALAFHYEANEKSKQNRIEIELDIYMCKR